MPIGTFKQCNQRYPDIDSIAEIGDYVEQDEEIATIETDKVHSRIRMMREVKGS